MADEHCRFVGSQRPQQRRAPRHDPHTADTRAGTMSGPNKSLIAVAAKQTEHVSFQEPLAKFIANEYEMVSSAPRPHM